jgi:hypothetical protein
MKANKAHKNRSNSGGVETMMSPNVSKVGRLSVLGAEKSSVSKAKQPVAKIDRKSQPGARFNSFDKRIEE